MGERTRLAPEWARHGHNRLIAAPLRGDRTLWQPDATRPRCPHCAAILRPGGVLCGWDPGTRRTWVACKQCDGSWAEADTTELVQALAVFWSTRRRVWTLRELPDVDPAALFGAEAAHRAAIRDLRRLHLEVPPETAFDAA